jgi:hypothetical protein
MRGAHGEGERANEIFSLQSELRDGTSKAKAKSRHTKSLRGPVSTMCAAFYTFGG